MTVGKQERDVTDNKMLSVIPVAGIFSSFSCSMQYGVITPPLHLFMLGIVCHCFCGNPSVVCPLYIDKAYCGRRACHVCAGYMDGCQPDVLPYLFSAIPLSSYMLAGNLADFLPSVTASLRWCDLLFPISTVVTVFLTFRIGCRQKITLRFSRRTYFVLLIFHVPC